eukprot:8718911-Pyramimonas_sp.AAC.1
MDQCSALPHPRPVLDKVPAPVPTPLIEAARSAMGDGEKTAAQAVPPRRIKRQAVAMRAIRDGLLRRAPRPADRPPSAALGPG